MAKSNNPGQRKHLLSLQEREDITNAMNETIPDPNYVEVLELWGSVEPMSGSEYFQAQQNRSRASLKINTIYYENFNSSQSTNMRFVDKSDNRIYNVEFTKNPGQWHEQIDWFVREDTSTDA
jgi:SPP1 family predicted phage head-tail adaptor